MKEEEEDQQSNKKSEGHSIHNFYVEIPHENTSLNLSLCGNDSPSVEQKKDSMLVNVKPKPLKNR